MVFKACSPVQDMWGWNSRAWGIWVFRLLLTLSLDVGAWETQLRCLTWRAISSKPVARGSGNRLGPICHPGAVVSQSRESPASPEGSVSYGLLLLSAR